MSGRSGDGDRARPLWQRLAWFAALWLASVAVLGVIAYGLRKVLLG